MTYGKYYCGNEISIYGREHGFVDYRTFAKSFDAVLNNDLMGELENHGYYFEQISGFVDNSEEIKELEERLEEIENAIAELEEANENYHEKIGAYHPIAKKRIEELEEEKEGIEEEIEVLQDEQENYYSQEVFQWYIVPDLNRSLEENNEIVFYCEELDLYMWGVTHWGTPWDYVLTSIPCEKGV